MTDSPAPLADTAREIADLLAAPGTPPPEDWIAEIDATVADRCPDLAPRDMVGLANRVVARLNDRLDLGLPKRTLHQPPAAIEPLRDKRWSADAARAIALRHALDLRLPEFGRSPSAEDLPWLILLSAALRGGLWRPEALLALARCLAEGRVPLELADAFHDLAAVDLNLTIDPKRQAQTNTVAGRELLRWFPDVTTLSLIDRWMRRGPMPWTAPTTATRMFAGMLDFLRTPAADAPPFARFAAAAPAALERISGADLSAAIEGVASGQSPGLSVTTDAWHALATRGSAPKLPISAASASHQDKVGPPRKSSARRAAGSEDHRRAALGVFHKLRLAYAATSSRKGTKAFADGLRRLQREQGADWPAFAALLSWYRSLLATNDKPRTIADYHSQIGKHLLDVMGTTDPCALEPAALRALLEQVLARSGYTDPTSPLQRLAHFASHAHRVMDWPDADLVDLGDGRAKDQAKFVRTAMPPMTVYPEVFEAIRTAADIPPELAECYAIAFALIAWGGLRIDEAEGRVVDDLAPDLTVFIHVTDGHGLKSEAARRLVPVGLFAPPDIAARVRDYAARRRHAPDPARDRLLDPGSLMPGKSFGMATFRLLIDRSLGHMLDLKVTPHAFRHSLISAVHLLFQLRETGQDVTEAVTGWPPEQQERILHALLGPVPDPGRAPRQISALAGHQELSPVSGSTYCHLTDLALGVMIREAGERMPVEQAAHHLGFRKTTVQPVAAPDGTVRLEDLRALVLARMRISRRRPRSPGEAGAALPPPSPGKIDAKLVHEILLAVERDEGEDMIADTLRVSTAQVAAVIAAARDRMTAVTAKRSARMPAPRGRGGLMPAARFFREERAFFDHLLRNAGDLPAADRRTWLETVLARSDRHRKYLRFASAGDAAAWLRLFPAAIPADALIVTICCPRDIDPEKALAAWRKELGADPDYRTVCTRHATSRSASAPGTVALRADVNSRKTRRSFATLRLAAFCIAIAEAARAADPG
ncbi:site-specific integrase [Mangrovicoccus sp. HB161399]|uniref:site-specific integrase n=1 Tax=Mangrovicoccus sp. HB161399 TaxID=2720392 RepID=UPI0015524464|nr:site-specific integrase [Mangrovicoccus sp. HB161399]